MWFLFLFFIENLSAQEPKPRPYAECSQKLKAYIDCSSKNISLSLSPKKRISPQITNRNVLKNATKILQKIDAIDFLKKIENFLNSLKTLQGSFIELDQYQQSKGNFFFLRPNLMKMKYEKPIQGLQKPTIIIKNSTVTYYDHALKEKTSTTIFSSPLSFFFDPKVTLIENVEILDFMSQKDFSYIKLSKKNSENPESITLKFSNAPFMLKEWRIFSDKNVQIPNIIITFDDNMKIDHTIDSEEFEKF